MCASGCRQPRAVQDEEQRAPLWWRPPAVPLGVAGASTSSPLAGTGALKEGAPHQEAGRPGSLARRLIARQITV